MRNPKNPTRAEARCKTGLSKSEPTLPGIFSRKEMRVKLRRKKADSPRAMAMNAGVAALGDVRSSRGAFSGSALRSSERTR